MQTVTVKYLVGMADRAGRSVETVDLDEGATLADLAAQLRDRYGIRIPDPGIIAVLNGKGWMQHPAGLETRLSKGDVILLFPPISGG